MSTTTEFPHSGTAPVRRRYAVSVPLGTVFTTDNLNRATSVAAGLRSNGERAVQVRDTTTGLVQS